MKTYYVMIANDSSFSEDSANDDDTDNSSSSEDVLSLMTEREDLRLMKDLRSNHIRFHCVSCIMHIVTAVNNMIE